jgi:signal transduction histidine kinase
MAEQTERAQGRAPWEVPSAVMRYRWAFEPVLAVAFFGIWTVSGVLLGSSSDMRSVLFLAVAIAFSRISPIGALASGVCALGIILTGVTEPAWVYCSAGVVVCFGAAAYGNKVERWIGLAGAIVLAVLIGVVQLSASFLGANQGLGGILGTLSVIVSFLVGVMVQSSLVVGAWTIGLALHQRARQREVLAPVSSAGEPPNPSEWTGFEEALIGPNRPDPAKPVTRASLLFGSVSSRQLSVDIAVALVFLFVALPSWFDVPSIAVTIGFTLALALRRVSPALALALAWVSALLQVAEGLPILTANFAVLAVLYTAAAYGGRVVKWAGLVSVGVGALIVGFYLSGILPGWYRAELAAADSTMASAAPDLAGLLFRLAGTFVASVGVLGLSWTLGLLIRTWKNARLSRRQEVRAVEEQRIAQRSVVVEQERNRIARDMHDVVAHSLAVVIAQADGARYVRASDPTAVDAALTTISATAREALADVRILLTQLRQQEVQGPQPVLADLDRLIEQMRGAGLAIVWTTTGLAQNLGSGAQLSLYRIIQEALTNALRHGDPDHRVHLSVRWDDASVTAVVVNAVRASRQFDESAGVGHGLPGMRERALLAGGTLETILIDGQFTVTAVLPILVGVSTGELRRIPVRESS